MGILGINFQKILESFEKGYRLQTVIRYIVSYVLLLFYLKLFLKNLSLAGKADVLDRQTRCTSQKNGVICVNKEGGEK